MKKYELYLSEDTPSTTVLEADAEDKEDILEKDAKLICRFVAPSWEDAKAYADMVISKLP
ncbi:MAG: hypothetical protein H8D23_10825 [Candidatus Brocadiales bacterium]|nr:hypothetical protein [Candidatus Brocadiales bacterium]